MKRHESSFNLIHYVLFLCSDYENFAEKGLSEVRQRLRYEHYEEKR